jgi:uncharacterized membrane protein
LLFSIIDLLIGVFVGGSALGGIFGALGVVFIFSGLLSFIFAITFLTGRNWGRIFMIIGAILELFDFPIGIIIGIVILWYLTRPRIKAYFKQPKGRKAMRPA